MTLRELRIQKAVTTVDLARAAGISQGGYSNIESGRRATTAAMSKRIADALGEDVAVVTSAIHEIPRRTLLVNSWISAVRIDGLPLLRAFKYHVEAEKIPVDDTGILRRALVDFVSANIARSLTMELSERDDVLRRIQAAVGGEDELVSGQGRQNGRTNRNHTMASITVTSCR